MKIFLVGGAVRDEIMGIKPTDYDYVVVGSSEDEMLKNGFVKVGSDFPVFLHPKNRCEYALARKEKKVMSGHKGFEYEWEGVSLEEDLYRRDLTINAIAKDIDTGQFIDPYQGVKDIKKKVLRHVSIHFKEDPLRVLRVGRFLSRFHDFEVAISTIKICKEISDDNELMTLSGERIFAETSKALACDYSFRYFEFLRTTGALKKVFPELNQIYGVPQDIKYHLEGDVWVHTMLVLKSACHLSESLEVRFAALVHDLGKGRTPSDILPSHIGHEIRGVPIVENICNRWRVSRKVKKIAIKVTKYHLQIHQCMQMRASKLLILLKHIEAFRNSDVFDQILLVCQADAMGKLNKDYPQAEYLRFIAKSVQQLQIAKLIDGAPQDKIPGIILDSEIKTVKQAINSYKISEKN